MRSIFWLIAAILVLSVFIIGCSSGTSSEISDNPETGDEVLVVNTETEQVQLPDERKILIVYFSRTGNTREIVKQINEVAGGDVVEIKMVNPYPENYDDVVKQSRRELEENYLPPIKFSPELKDFGSYNVVFVGYPIWIGTQPPPVKTFLTENNLEGKIVVPFCTHGGGGKGTSVADIKKLCPKSNILEDFSVKGADAKSAQSEVSKWLQKIGITAAAAEDETSS